LRFSYKTSPDKTGGFDWVAELSIQISNAAKHSPPTKKIDAMLDSGASQCIFHSSLGRAIGLAVEKGDADRTIGVSGQPTRIYMHNISLHVPGGHILRIRAAFSDDLPVAALLGRRGFFEHFKVLFDPSGPTPGFDIERVYRDS
jgi:hypothetical protein